MSERRGLRLGSVGGLLFFAEVGRGDAGVEAAGGKPQQGGGEDEDTKGGHGAFYFMSLFLIGKRLV